MNEPILDSFVTVLKYLLTGDGSANGPQSIPIPLSGTPGLGPDPTMGGIDPTSPPGGPQPGQPPVQDDLAPILAQLQGQGGPSPIPQPMGLGGPPSSPPPGMGSPMGQRPQRLGSMAAGMRSAPNQMKDNLAGTLQKLGIPV